MGDPATSNPEQIENPKRSDTLAARAELPSVGITLGALAMPFRYLPELVRFGAIVFALSLANAIVLHYLTRAIVRYWWIMLSHEAIYAPFALVWTRIAVLGRKSVSTISRYRYGAVEIRYLIASLLLVTVLLGPILILLGWTLAAHQSGATTTAEVLSVVILAVMFVDLIVFVRMSFLFPAIALGRYRGVAAAWRQTQGYFERLCAIEAAVLAPYIAIHIVYQKYWYIWFFSYETWFSKLMFVIVDVAMSLLGYVAIAAAPALAFKFLVHEGIGPATFSAGNPAVIPDASRPAVKS